MIQIRKNTFETNSSSVHTICISNEDYINSNSVSVSIEFYRKHGLPCKLGQFGWESSVIDYADNKLSYLYTAIKELNGWYISEYGKPLYDFNYIENTLNELGVDLYYPENDYDYYYVDHAYDTKEFLDYIYEDKSHLINFIFNNNSIIFTGNDNSDYYVDANSDKIPENCTVFEKGN